MQLSDLNMSSNTNIFSRLSELDDSDIGVNQDGGFFNFLCDESKVEKAVLEAVRLKKYDIVDFFVDKDLIVSYDYKDESGNTLLHYLALDYDNTRNIINKLLKRGDVKKFINTQNDNGDTLLIMAVMAGHHDLCTELIKKGADKSIKNRQNMNVDTETDILSSIKAKAYSPKESIFNPILAMLQNKNSNSRNTSDAYTFSAMNRSEQSPKLMSDTMDTEKFIKQLSERLNESRYMKPANQLGGGECPECQMIGGGCGCGNFEDVQETEDLLHTLKSYMSNQDGGKRKKKTVVGKRTIPKFVDGNMEHDNTELARILNNKAGEIIEDIIKKLQDIIVKYKIGPKGEKDTEAVARVYKAALWEMVKFDPKGEAKTSVDIAVNIKKQLEDPEKIKKVLLDVDYDKWANILKDAKERREKRLQEMQSTSQDSSYTINISDSDSDYDSSSEYVRTRTVSDTSY